MLMLGKEKENPHYSLVIILCFFVCVFVILGKNKRGCLSGCFLFVLYNTNYIYSNIVTNYKTVYSVGIPLSIF